MGCEPIRQLRIREEPGQPLHMPRTLCSLGSCHVVQQVGQQRHARPRPFRLLCQEPEARVTEGGVFSSHRSDHRLFELLKNCCCRRARPARLRESDQRHTAEVRTGVGESRHQRPGLPTLQQGESQRMLKEAVVCCACCIHERRRCDCTA